MNLYELYEIADENAINVDYFPMRQAVSISIPDSIAIDIDKIETCREEKAVLAHELEMCIRDRMYSTRPCPFLRNGYIFKLRSCGFIQPPHPTKKISQILFCRIFRFRHALVFVGQMQGQITAAKICMHQPR